MKIYLAARYSRAAEMREVRQRIENAGHTVTSTWIDQTIGEIPRDTLNTEPMAHAQYAQRDFADLIDAEAVISFTSMDGGGRGGRHIEFGMALALNKRLIIVGPRENVFHTLSGVEVYHDIDAMLEAWAEIRYERDWRP